VSASAGPAVTDPAPARDTPAAGTKPAAGSAETP
jgi:hypothetical protein